MAAVEELRREDRRLLVGEGRYIGDLSQPGQLYLAVARSPHAHADILGVETDDSQRTAGVVGVFTAADLPELGELRAAAVVPNMPLPPAPVLASGSVHFVGQPVVGVVATSEAAARDGVAALRIEYRTLPAIVGTEAAVSADAPLAFPNLGTNVAYRKTTSEGDLAGAFASADRVVRVRQVSGRIAGVPMESRGALAVWDGQQQELTMWAGVQAPFAARATLAGTLNLPETSIRVIAPDVGGGFGVKGGLYAEEVLTAVLARRLGRPLRWHGTRADDFQLTQHAREHVLELEGAFRNDGELLGLRLRVIYDLGAGARGAGVPGRFSLCLTGCYRVKALATEIITVYTNTVPTGAYRGAGRPEAALAIERLMDAAALDLGIDPAALRRRNFVPADAFPYRSPTGMVLDSGNFDGVLTEAKRRFDYAAARREQVRRRANGELVGIGLTTFIELTGAGWESGAVRVLPKGGVEVMTGSTDQGQGRATTWARLVAGVFGLAPERVRVLHGDTRLLASGVGSFGSRSLVVGGTAVLRAAEEVREKMLAIAAHQLEVAPADLVWADHGAHVRGAPERRLAFEQLAAAAYGGNLPTGMTPGLEQTHYFQAPGEAYTSGAYIAQVSIDCETGQVRVERLVAIDDCGQVISPLLTDGQQYGGIVQGLGQALCEEIFYDADGQLVSGSLMDYALPRASTVPTMEIGRIVTPSPLNPLGAKGIGEAGTIGAPPVILNAVLDALRPLGVTELALPLTAARVWAALQQAEGAAHA